MADDWVEMSLGDLVDIKHGFAFKGEFFRNEPPGDVLLTPGNFAVGGGFKANRLKYYVGPVPDEFVLSEGDLLVTMTDLSKNADTLGYPALVPSGDAGHRYLHNQRLGKLIARADSKVDLRFLHYLLCCAEYRTEIVAGATGTTVKHTSPGRIKRFRFRVPPSDEQRAIAHILGTLDDKIQLNRRMSETLEAMARALFKSWFVDFDPVRAKAEGRDPRLSGPFADLFPARLVDSELGELPRGWAVTPFSDVVELIREKEHPSESPDVVYLHFSIPAFDDGQQAKKERGGAIKSQKSRVPPGVVLLSKLNPEIERVWLVDVQLNDRAVCSTEFLVLRPRPPVGRAFAYCLARSATFRQELKGLVTGTSKSHQRARADAILGLSVVQPGGAIIEKFEQQAGSLLEKALVCRRESRTLAALRDTLLPKLISGELQLPAPRDLVEARL